MKKIRHLLIALMLVCLNLGLIAQPDPTHNGDGTDVGGEPIGNSAPIGNGAIIIISLALVYMGKKLWDNRDKLIE